MSTRTLLALLRAHGIDVDAMHATYRRHLAQMSDAQRELVAILAAAAHANGGAR